MREIDRITCPTHDDGEQPDWDYEPEDSAMESMSYWDADYMYNAALSGWPGKDERRKRNDQDQETNQAP